MLFKKFFFAVVLALLMTSSQIADAEDYDWSQAPRIATKIELAGYIENGRRNGQKVFNLIITNSRIFDVFNEQPKYFAVAPLVTSREGHPESGQITFKIIEEYPGTRVANAYLNQFPDIAWKNLSDDERDLYSNALPIVNEANKRPSEREKMRYIYNEINKRSTYYDEEDNYMITGDNKRIKPFCTAIGVQINGKRGYNCQGYADAFYMIGRMCNLDVRRISGMLKGSSHQWNAIIFNDGESYCVDVQSGTRFCVNKKHMEEFGYWCEWDAIPNLQ